MKYCGLCKQTKPREQFHNSCATKDGLATKCKECQSQYASKWHWENRERCLKVKKDYYARNKRKILDRCGKYLKKKMAGNTVLIKAHNSVRGMKRQPCEICGELKVEAHHPDYSKPKYIRWLCVKHHKLEHSTILKKILNH